jgi:hypothetical protein
LIKQFSAFVENIIIYEKSNMLDIRYIGHPM